MFLIHSNNIIQYNTDPLGEATLLRDFYGMLRLITFSVLALSLFNLI